MNVTEIQEGKKMFAKLVAIAILAVTPLATLAAPSPKCAALPGKGAGFEKIPPYQDVLAIFDCAGMAKDVKALDPADHDIMVMRAKTLTLDELKLKETSSTNPKKYSQITSKSRLARFKNIVDTYFKKP